MGTVITIFMIIATIFALATIAYVVIDIIIDIKNKKKQKKEEKEEEPEPEEPAPVVVPVVVAPAPEPEEDHTLIAAVPIIMDEEDEHEVMPEIVDHIDAIEADALISDDLAMENANYESGAGQGEQGIVNIGFIDANFEANEVVTLERLKEKAMIRKNIGRLKVLADGMLNKPLTIKAESYSVQAIKMIELTGGTVIILKD